MGCNRNGLRQSSLPFGSQRAVELDQFAFAGRSQTALTMGGSAAFTRRTDAGLTRHTAEGFAAKGEALHLARFFAEVVIVEAGISGAPK